MQKIDVQKIVARSTTPVCSRCATLITAVYNAEFLRHPTEPMPGEKHMSAEQPTIIYTLTDEAPLLATYAFLPILRTFADAAGIDVKSSDISVAARILAEFGDYLSEEQRVPDNLAELGELTQRRRPTSSSCRTSARRCRSSWPPSRSCRPRATAPGLSGRAENRRREGDQERYGKCSAAP